MANDNDSKNNNEEEYLFSEDEHTDPLNPGDPSVQIPGEAFSEKESFWKKWRKNIIVGVGLFLVVFIVYKVISSFFESNDVKQQIPEIPAQSSVVSTALNNTPPVEQVNQSVSSTASLHDSVNLYNQNRQETQQLTQLEATTQNISAEVDSLQNTTQNLQSSIDNINGQLSQLNTALTALTNQMQTQENRWVQSQKKAKPKPVYHKPVIKREGYQTMAVIPGRAWLKSSQGATITVGVGTAIPGYGQVTAINTQSGRVVTSSGIIIKYAPNDE
jgi:methyl-accepting chemotaxis protein